MRSSIFARCAVRIQCVTLLAILFAVFPASDAHACTAQGTGSAAPSWVCNPQDAFLRTTLAIGHAYKTAAGQEFAFTEAEADARTKLLPLLLQAARQNLAGYLAAVRPGAADLARDLDAAVFRSIVVATGKDGEPTSMRGNISGSTVWKRELAANGDAFVLVIVDPKNTRINLANIYRKSMDADCAAWSKLASPYPAMAQADFIASFDPASAAPSLSVAESGPMTCPNPGPRE